MIWKYTRIILVVMVIASTQPMLFAQPHTTPVQVNTVLTPPYSLSLSDYVALGSNKLMVTLLLKDLNEHSYKVRLRFTIQGNGVTLVSNPNYIPPNPIVLTGGESLTLSGSDLSNYLNPNNLNFSGYSRSNYNTTNRLPEGFYTITVSVLDYFRGNVVSNAGTTMAWLVLNNPPIVNQPVNGIKLVATDPQSIIFNWSPRHLGSPNSAFTTEYVIRLVEIWPQGRDPNEAMRNSPVFHEITTAATSFQYGIMEPLLTPGRSYAFSVQARDTEGRDLFKNNGYSQVSMFTYGDECKPPTNISATGIRGNGLEFSWTSGNAHSAYLIRYRLSGSSSGWFTHTSYSSNPRIYDLTPDRTFEYQVMAECGTIQSNYSIILNANTLPFDENAFVCGSGSSLPAISNTTPLASIAPGETFTVGGFEATVTSVTIHSPGSFSGVALVKIPYLMNARVPHVFSNIRINELRQMYEGKLESTYNSQGSFIIQ